MPPRALSVSRLPALLSWACAWLLSLTACSGPGGPNLIEVAPEINATRLAGTFVITPGDTIAITFRFDPDFNQELTVLPDGTATLMVIGAKRVGGFTPEQVAQQLRAAYRDSGAIGKPDDLTVSILTTAPRNVTVLGEVNEPGPIALGLDQRLSLVEAIGQAGSFITRTAWLSNVLLVRWDPATQTQRAWLIDARPEFWSGRDPVLLQSFDVVYVPNTRIDRVGIWVDNFIRRLIPFPFFIPTT
jgi:protein involved in polysaccharide export with SLBB domain